MRKAVPDGTVARTDRAPRRSGPVARVASAQELLRAIRELAVAESTRAWPALGALLGEILPEPMDPLALVPVSTGQACGGSPSTLVPLAAAVALQAVALRILDDCADQDDERALHLSLGLGRAANAAAALDVIAESIFAGIPIARGRLDRLLTSRRAALIAVLSGQDRELEGTVSTLAEYEAVVADKTVAAFEFAAMAGALVAGADEDVVARCAAAGRNLGWMIQILDDIESLWFPDPAAVGPCRPGYPLFSGLPVGEASLADEADGLPRARMALCAALDDLGVRSSLLSRALDHRDAAIELFGAPLDPAGAAIFVPLCDWMLRDGEQLLHGPPTNYGRTRDRFVIIENGST